MMPARSPSASAFRITCSTTKSRFKEAVIDRFAESYVAGETPVPCVECNQSIKFRDLLETARELGAKVLATGHYVASRALPGGGRALYRAREAERDQSYFLFATTRDAARSACAFRSATAPRRRRASWRGISGCRSPTSRTARTSASCRPGTTPT